MDGRGVNQDRLSQAINVSQATISKWTRCESEPKADNIASVAKFFDVSADFLLGRSEGHALHYESGRAPVQDMTELRDAVDDLGDAMNKINSKLEAVRRSLADAAASKAENGSRSRRQKP